MSFSVGIVGLPNVGKSTLFQALTRQQVGISPRPFTTIDPNIGVVAVPDQRLDDLGDVIGPEKTTPTTIEFVDIAGLVKGAHKGEGLGNQFLAHIRNCDAILEIVRTFDNPKVENVLGGVDPKRDIEVIKTELLMKDLETLEKITAGLEKKKGKDETKDSAYLERVKKGVAAGKMISEMDLSEKERRGIAEYQLLCAKPVIYLFNKGSKEEETPLPGITMDLKIEAEITELSAGERQELEIRSQLDKIIKACYDTLRLITFFTVTGGREVRAWTLPRGASVLEAGETVHSDFRDRFIRAEVIDWRSLIDAGSWQKARERGIIKTVGKEYAVQDGDVIEFKI
jgi:ribosome-binding ATPase YchF (GTP1/OBG family)